jgi:hypothetical protein
VGKELEAFISSGHVPVQHSFLSTRGQMERSHNLAVDKLDLQVEMAIKHEEARAMTESARHQADAMVATTAGLAAINMHRILSLTATNEDEMAIAETFTSSYVLSRHTIFQRSAMRR